MHSKYFLDWVKVRLCRRLNTVKPNYNLERDSNANTQIIFLLLGWYHCFYHWYVYDLFSVLLSAMTYDDFSKNDKRITNSFSYYSVQN